MSSNNPVIQHEVIVYNITLCTNTFFTMLYIQYVFRFQSSPTFEGGRGCNTFVPVLGGNGTKIAPNGDIFYQPSGEML